MCDEKNKIDELVTELDNFFGNGGSHMNVEFNSDDGVKTIKTNYNIPTMFVIGGCSYHTSRKTLPYPADIVFRVHENGEVESW